MHVSEQGLQFIRDREQLRLKAYWDVDGWAIGYGDRRNVTEGMVIDRAEAERRLASRIVEFEQGVRQLLTRQPSQLQFDAMVSLAYNIGLGWQGAKKRSGERDGFRQSTVLRAFNAGNDVAAGTAFGLWCKITVDGKRVDSLGLVQRRALEKAMFLSGVAVETAPPRPAEVASLEQSGTVQGAQVAGALTALGMAKSLVDQFQDTLMNVPWVGDLFKLVVAYSPKVALALGVGALGAVAYVIWRRIDDRSAGRV